jgi:hypothetical protein
VDSLTTPQRRGNQPTGYVSQNGSLQASPAGYVSNVDYEREPGSYVSGADAARAPGSYVDSEFPSRR